MAWQRNYNWGAQTPQEAMGDVSRINAAQLVNMRLQNYWRDCGHLWKRARFNEAYDILSLLWTEFYADATEDERKEVERLDKEVDLFINKRNNVVKQNGKNKKMWLYYHRLYLQSIFNKWLFLKTLEKKQGVGRAYIDKDEDDFE